MNNFPFERLQSFLKPTFTFLYPDHRGQPACFGFLVGAFAYEVPLESACISFSDGKKGPAVRTLNPKHCDAETTLDSQFLNLLIGVESDPSFVC